MDRYSQADWISTSTLVEMQTDLMTLESLKLRLTTDFAHLIAYSECISDKLRLGRAKVASRLRDLCTQSNANGDPVRSTADEIKDLSYSIVGTDQLETDRAEGLAVKYFYYAIRDCCDKLERSLTRLWGLERDYSRQAESHNTRHDYTNTNRENTVNLPSDGTEC